MNKKKIAFLLAAMMTVTSALPVSASVSDNTKEIKSFSENSPAEAAPAAADDASVFDGEVDGFEYTVSDNNEARITKYKGNAENVNIPAKIGNYTIVQINHDAFNGNTSIKTVSIPSSVRQIDTDAFADCSALEEIKFSEGIQKLWSGVFSNCTALKKVTIPASLEFIGADTFSNTGISEIEFAENGKLTEIYDCAFGKCNNLKHVAVPDSVKVLSRTFAWDNELVSVKFSNNQPELEVGVVSSCPKLEKVYIPVSVKKINNLAFLNDEKLSKVYYSGSKEDWEKIEIGSESKDVLDKAKIKYNSTVDDFNKDAGSDDPSKPTPSLNGITISYNTTIPFAGKKIKAESFGTISISCNGNTYTASKIKVNKKLKTFQITKISPADKKVQKELKKATKGSCGLPFTVAPFQVSDNTALKTKFSKSGDLKSVKIQLLSGKYFKCKKTEYSYDRNTKVISFQGENFTGAYTVK